MSWKKQNRTYVDRAFGKDLDELGQVFGIKRLQLMTSDANESGWATESDLDYKNRILKYGSI